jgi:hypothetical protein
MQGLKRVAQTGVTVTAVIHQPSYETFCLFDDLVLLAKGGLTAYCGPQRDVRVRLRSWVFAVYLVHSTPQCLLHALRAVHGDVEAICKIDWISPCSHGIEFMQAFSEGAGFFIIGHMLSRTSPDGV